MTRTLALDLGGTRLRAGLAVRESPVRLDPLGAWPAPGDLEELTQRLTALVVEHDVARIGLAVPGLVTGTTCTWIPNLPWLDGYDLAPRFPGIAVGHDAQLALLAETTAGAAQGLSDALLLAIGTGIGSAVLAGGRIVRGCNGAACSFGWACADLGDPGDPRLGWLERTASGSALDPAAREIGLADGAALIDAARNGEVRAREQLARPTQALGIALAGAVALLAPQAVILAGGVASAADVLGPAIEAAMRRHLPPHLQSVPVVAGTFGPEASLAGAAIAARRGASWDEVR
jgi:glucokinase